MLSRHSILDYSSAQRGEFPPASAVDSALNLNMTYVDFSLISVSTLIPNMVNVVGKFQLLICTATWIFHSWDFWLCPES